MQSELVAVLHVSVLAQNGTAVQAVQVLNAGGVRYEPPKQAVHSLELGPLQAAHEGSHWAAARPPSSSNAASSTPIARPVNSQVSDWS